MSDEQPWMLLRELEPPLGAKRRVLNDLLQPPCVPANSQRWWLVGGAALIAVIVATAWRARPLDVPFASSVHTYTTPDESVGNPTRLRWPAGSAHAGLAARSAMEAKGLIRLRPNERAQLVTKTARIELTGPAKLSVDGTRIHVATGTLEVSGTAVIAGPLCRAHVAGRARVDISTAKLQVSVFAGSATIAPKNRSCSVQYVANMLRPQPATPATAAAARSPRRPSRSASSRSASSRSASSRSAPLQSAPLQPHVPIRPLPTPDPATTKAPAAQRRDKTVKPNLTLRGQVNAFRDARALHYKNDRAALRAWQAFLRRWPHSALRPEAEANQIFAMHRLGHNDDARALARNYILRYPFSSHVDAFRALVAGRK